MFTVDGTMTKDEYLKFTISMGKCQEWARSVGMKESDITDTIKAVRAKKRAENELSLIHI